MASDSDMGAKVFYEMAAKLKREGDGGGLRKRFLKEMKEAAKPLLPAVRRQAEARFPTKGGLNRHMARGTRYRTVAKTGLTTAGVSIRANKTDPRADRRGRISHPIPGPGGEPLRDEKGHRIMAVQYFPNAVGFFSETIEERSHGIRKELLDGLERWATDLGLH